ncbi:MAG: hypothetical protein ACM3Y9_17185 [Ignavibacteria bacterium]
MTNLELIQLRFPHRALLTLLEACQLLGICAATARNQICLKTFPVPVIKVNKRSYLSVIDLAEYLDGMVVACRGSTEDAVTRPAPCALRIGKPIIAKQQTRKLGGKLEATPPKDRRKIEAD